MCLCVSVSFAASPSPGKLLYHSLEFYRSDAMKTAAANVLSYQTPAGGWPKNVNTAGAPFEGDMNAMHATFDNGATTEELRLLARMTAATGDEQYKAAFLRGLDHILKAQYPSGGWPQTYPPGENDYDHYITFNDGAMVRVMFFLKEVADRDFAYDGDGKQRVEHLYDFVDDARRQKCAAAWDSGIECILKCQIKVDGKLTAWCQQHDEITYEPRPARKFELVGLSGSETVGICHALMSVEHPSPPVVAAVDAAVAWLESVKISGIRIEDRKQDGTPRGFERFVVSDPAAPPLWARYYQIGTNRPFFAGRDSVMHFDLSEIQIERRTGYNWYGKWPRNLIESEYPAWKKRIAGASAQPTTMEMEEAK